jgi:hypothetical protein
VVLLPLLATKAVSPAALRSRASGLRSPVARRHLADRLFGFDLGKDEERVLIREIQRGWVEKLPNICWVDYYTHLKAPGRSIRLLHIPATVKTSFRYQQTMK